MPERDGAAWRCRARSITVGVVAHVNLTQRSGAIAAIRPFPALVATSPADTSVVTLRTAADDGTVISEHAVRVALTPNLAAGDDQTGIIDTLIAVEVGAIIQLVLDGDVIDTFHPFRK